MYHRTARYLLKYGFQVYKICGSKDTVEGGLQVSELEMKMECHNGFRVYNSWKF